MTKLNSGDADKVHCDQTVNALELIELFSNMAKRGTLLTGGSVTQQDLLMQITGTIVQKVLSDKCYLNTTGEEQRFTFSQRVVSSDDKNEEFTQFCADHFRSKSLREQWTIVEGRLQYLLCDLKTAADMEDLMLLNDVKQAIIVFMSVISFGECNKVFLINMNNDFYTSLGKLEERHPDIKTFEIRIFMEEVYFKPLGYNYSDGATNFHKSSNETSDVKGE